MKFFYERDLTLVDENKSEKRRKKLLQIYAALDIKNSKMFNTQRAYKKQQNAKNEVRKVINFTLLLTNTQTWFVLMRCKTLKNLLQLAQINFASLRDWKNCIKNCSLHCITKKKFISSLSLHSDFIDILY